MKINKTSDMTTGVIVGRSYRNTDMSYIGDSLLEETA